MISRLLLSTVCVVATGIAGPTLTLAAVKQAQADALVDAVARHLEGHAEAGWAVLAEERYHQTFTRANARQQQRFAKSEVLLLVQRGGDPLWLRDVVEINGTRLASAQDRLLHLVTGPVETFHARRAPIEFQNAAHVLGSGLDALITPTAVLEYLVPRHRGRFVFRTEGSRTVERLQTVALSFKEAQAPDPALGYFAAPVVEGRLWIHGDSGQVLQSELRLSTARYSAKITVRYQPQGPDKPWAPVRLDADYRAGVGTSRVIGRSLGHSDADEVVTIRTDYSRVRRLTGIEVPSAR